MSDTVKSRASALSHAVERALSGIALGLMAALPVAELAGRMFFGHGISGSGPLVQQLTFCITFLGAALAARSGQLIALSTPSLLPERFSGAARVLTSGLGAAIALWLAYASLDVVRIDYQDAALGQSNGYVAWGIPVWTIALTMPLGLLLIAFRLWWAASERWRGRWIAAGVGLIVIAAAMMPGVTPSTLLGPALLLLLLATILGLPIFAALGGAALLLFWSDGFSAAVVPLKINELSAAELLPALPLFALAGYFLAEGGAGHRLMRVFNALFGWLPGGLAIAVTLVLAFFTTLGSGVTIVSLGGLILTAMQKAGYSEKSSIGLITVGGSTGLLFPPSIPVILYGIQAQVPINQLFIGGVIPGALLVLVVAGWGAFAGYRSGAPTQPFAVPEVLPALWAAKWDLFTPVIVVAGFAGGSATVLEAAALAVFYTLFVQFVVHRELSLRKDVLRIAVECSAMVGGFLILLGVALAFMHYLSLAEVPLKALAWVQGHISSPAMFLLALNVFLIVVGAVTDIFSAIFVIVPLIVPIATGYHIHPVHLGVIFLTNMELGYLMPPMGENLFLSSIRFKRKLGWIYVSTLPYLLLILAVVLLVTYVPVLTLGPLEWWFQ